MLKIRGGVQLSVLHLPYETLQALRSEAEAAGCISIVTLLDSVMRTIDLCDAERADRRFCAVM